ncbi:hypothetical protein ACFL2T_00335 [Elusimicrobiota bacterium]
MSQRASDSGKTPVVGHHDRRVAELKTLGALLGCHEDIGNQLPDGRRPDVVRLSHSKRLLFIGDAKDTESPGSRASQARLEAYLSWMRANVASGARGLMVICYGRRTDTEGWLSTLTTLADECGIEVQDAGTETFGPGLWITWLYMGGQPHL